MFEPVILRPLDPERDGEALHAIWGDEESCRYMTREPTANAAETIALLKEWTAGGEDTSWAVLEDERGPVLGRVAIFPRLERNAVWECGCMIVPAARGRNLAARALAQAIDDAFDNKGIRRVVADIDPDNLASVRVFERLGFRWEGRLRGEWVTHIGQRDSLIYGLLRDDPRPWRERDAR
jgi:ribosomal-protein-alanine N-acetyltransferase